VCAASQTADNASKKSLDDTEQQQPQLQPGDDEKDKDEEEEGDDNVGELSEKMNQSSMLTAAARDTVRDRDQVLARWVQFRWPMFSVSVK